MGRKNESEDGEYVMAVTEVRVNLGRDSTELEISENNKYNGSMRAPRKAGAYSVDIVATNSSGDVSVANEELYVIWWKPPKTNWTKNDRFNIVDYNRIKNNLIYLHERAVELWHPFSIEDMGEDLTSVEQDYDVDVFNMFERNLDVINKNIFTQNYGAMQRFFANGRFIAWDELNRIESAILSMRMLLDGQKAGVRRLSFRLGAFKVEREQLTKDEIVDETNKILRRLPFRLKEDERGDEVWQ